jgi:succinoglycan biosynthesis protein ExoM
LNLTSEGHTVLISICIATYKRAGLLQKLLGSIIKQELPKNHYLEVIIVDNDINESARTVVSNFKNTQEIQFYYYSQPIKNISLTRNLGIKNATGEYICMIDDDEVADEKWISTLYDCLIKYDADGVFGYVTPYFEGGISETMMKREIYFSKMNETGTKALFKFAGNVMLKSSTIKNEGILFDPSYGLTGGEDSHLFEKLQKLDYKFINCREAVSYEYISKERTTRNFLFNRALRGGQVFIRKALEKNNSFKIRFLLFAKTAIKFVVGSFLAFISFPIMSINYRYIQLLGGSVGNFRGLFNKFKKLH